MEFIIFGAIAAVSVFGISAYQKKANEEQYQVEKMEMKDFIQKVLMDRVIFRKMSTFGILSNNFQASDDGFFVDVKVTKDEIEFILYSNKKIHRIYYRYVFNRSRNVGQMIDSIKEFSISNDVLIRQLEKKVTEYDWENPISFHAKKSFEIFNELKPKSSVTESEQEKVFNEFKNEINALEVMYFEIKKAADEHFSYEDKHNLERLFHNDLEKLKETFLLIQNKSPENMEMMKDSLSIIENRLREFYNKADMHHKQSFERTVEIIKNRDK